MRTITEAEFTDALKQAVKRNGEDYKYDKEQAAQIREANGLEISSSAGRCFYTLDGENGSCVIGTTFEILGLDFPPEGVSSFTYMDDLMKTTEYKFARGLAWAASMAQGEQDSGGTWGNALVMYENALILMHRFTEEI